MCPADSGKSVLELFPCSILTPWSGKGEAGEVWPNLPKLIPLYLADRLWTEPFREEVFQQNFMAEVRRGASPLSFVRGVAGSCHQQCEVCQAGWDH